MNIPSYIKGPKPSKILKMINSPAQPYIECIANGSKKAEGRIASPSHRELKIGQIICLHHAPTKKWVTCEITYIHHYSSFKEMLENEGLKNMLPFAKTLEEGIAIYMSFPKAERVHSMGALAIGIKPLASSEI
ncbi:MAG TPA: ASCH domain-containing protein [Chlamydiales bacterium]|nr:ASCH domain-containing protein [Chlamydiales bacterium]